MEPGRDADAPRRRFADWFATPPGSRLLEAERPILKETVRRLHGDCLLWIGVTADLADTTAQCMVRSRICSIPQGSLEPGCTIRPPECLDVVCADAGELPFADSSIDGVVLHHALDIATDRRGTLREAARVVRSGGRLVVVGYNPLSMWLWIKPFSGFRDLRGVTVFRLREWLTVLGFARDGRTIYLNYRGALPMALDGRRFRAASAWINRCQPPVGGVYVAVAVKQERGYTAVGLARDRHRRNLAPAALPNATRQADWSS